MNNNISFEVAWIKTETTLKRSESSRFSNQIPGRSPTCSSKIYLPPISTRFFKTWRDKSRLKFPNLQILNNFLAGFYPDSNFPVLTIEAKTLTKSLHEEFVPAVAQSFTGIIAMMDRMFTSFGYRPKTFCGILTNGKDWILLQRKLKDGRYFCSHTPAISVFDNANATEKGKKSLLNLLTHVLGVARQHIKWMQSLSSVTPIPESDDPTKSDGGDDADQGDDGRGGGEAKEPAIRGPPTGLGRNRNNKKKDRENQDQGKENQGSTTKNLQGDTEPVLSCEILKSWKVDEFRSIRRFEIMNKDQCK